MALSTTILLNENTVHWYVLSGLRATSASIQASTLRILIQKCLREIPFPVEDGIMSSAAKTPWHFVDLPPTAYFHRPHFSHAPRTTISATTSKNSSHHLAASPTKPTPLVCNTKRQQAEIEVKQHFQRHRYPSTKHLDPAPIVLLLIARRTIHGIALCWTVRAYRPSAAGVHKAAVAAGHC